MEWAGVSNLVLKCVGLESDLYLLIDLLTPTQPDSLLDLNMTISLGVICLTYVNDLHVKGLHIITFVCHYLRFTCIRRCENERPFTH